MCGARGGTCNRASRLSLSQTTHSSTIWSCSIACIGRAICDAALTLAGVDHDAGTRCRRINELETCWHGPVGEEMLATADEHRDDQQAILIDQIVLRQGLDELATARNLNLAPVLLLEPGDLLGDGAR